MSTRLLVLLVLGAVLFVCLVCATVLYALRVPFPETAFGNLASAVLGAMIVLASRTNGNGKRPPPQG